jgi:hypothetical protein
MIKKISNLSLVLLFAIVSFTASYAADPIKGGRKPVKSSSIVSVGYDEERRILEVEIPRREGEKDRRVYQYLNVSPKVYRAFMDAKSKGRYYDERIKNRYKYREVKK